jgi:hypothetical protein
MNNYAFISLLYPNKKGEWTYLEGAILIALGLRKQNVTEKIICMVTPDVTDEIINNLKIVYDDVVVVDYISPLEKSAIKIQGEIFDPEIYKSNNEYNDLCNIFTKLHIFDSKKFPYEKIVFIDNDLIPLKKFSNLFKYETPAGWLEKIYELENNIDNDIYTRVWGLWNNMKNNDLIPNIYTDIYKEPGSSINAGLLIIKPNYELFEKLISKLQKPKNEWFGDNYKHKGSISLNKKKVKYYSFPEQDFLTQEFSGEWRMLDGRFCAWGKHTKDEVYGIHMAGLKYEIKNEWKNYKCWMVQLPFDDGFSLITNKIAIWGLEKYPQLKTILMNKLKIYIYNELYDFDKISLLQYFQLNKYQQNLHDILYNKFKDY